MAIRRSHGAPIASWTYLIRPEGPCYLFCRAGSCLRPGPGGADFSAASYVKGAPPGNGKIGVLCELDSRGSTTCRTRLFGGAGSRTRAGYRRTVDLVAAFRH